MKLIEADVIIFTPKPDIASQNIKRQILKNFDFKEMELFGRRVYCNKEDRKILLVDLEEDSIYAEKIEESFRAKLFIFATRHSAASGIPALLTHTPGNWTSETLYGGRPRKVCIAPALCIKEALIQLTKYAEENGLSDWRVGLEVTHHGPYIEHVPAIFMELGSSKKQWSSEVAARAVAQAVIEVAERRIKGLPKHKIGVGFGGPHYAPIFTKLVLKCEYAIGHIIPQYVFDEVTEREIRMAIERTEEKVDAAVIEWKGLKKKHRDLLIPVLEQLGIKWVRV